MPGEVVQLPDKYLLLALGQESFPKSSKYPSTIMRLWRIFNTNSRLNYHVRIRRIYLQVYIVLELMQGGELLDQIIDSHAFSEREAAEIMYTVVKTVNFLHQEGVSDTSITIVIIIIILLLQQARFRG